VRCSSSEKGIGGAVRAAVAGSRLLAGVMISMPDPHVTVLGESIGARIVTEGSWDGHTGRLNVGPLPLRFGDNSYFPHLEAARLQGIEPTVIRQPGIAVDIDHPVDLALFLRLPQSAGTRTRTLLEELGVPALLARRGIA
jgi:hypothetical protein